MNTPLSTRRLPASLAWLLVVLATLALQGCGTATIRGTMVYQLDPRAIEKPLLYPPVPEVPRYMYVGELVGEQNFVKEDSLTRKGAQGIFHFLVGTFETPNAAPTVLQRPQGGAVDENGRIYVTDVSRHAVFVFDEKEGELQVWESAVGIKKFVSPIGVAPGANGEVLVADAELGVVVRLDRRGNPIGAIGKGLLKRPTGLARDKKSGTIYVSDTHAHDIKVFNEEGQLVGLIGGRGEGAISFNFPTHLAFANNELYVTDTMNSRIQVVTPDGLPVRRFGQRGLYIGNLVRPKGVGVDDEGNVYVVESYYDHLLVFNSGGQFLMGIGGTGYEPGKFYLPAGVWVDSRNRVFVADMFNGRISIFQFLGGRDG